MGRFLRIGCHKSRLTCGGRRVKIRARSVLVPWSRNGFKWECSEKKECQYTQILEILHSPPPFLTREPCLPRYKKGRNIRQCTTHLPHSVTQIIKTINRTERIKHKERWNRRSSTYSQRKLRLARLLIGNSKVQSKNFGTQWHTFQVTVKTFLVLSPGHWWTCLSPRVDSSREER